MTYLGNVAAIGGGAVVVIAMVGTAVYILSSITDGWHSRRVHVAMSAAWILLFVLIVAGVATYAQQQDAHDRQQQAPR